jgi:hypothetical protein
VGGSQNFPKRLRLIAAGASADGFAEDAPICNFLSTNGDLHMKIQFIQYGTKSECQLVGETEEVLESESASGAKLLEDFGQLLESKELTDLEVQSFDGKVFPVHKCILSGDLNLIRISTSVVNFAVLKLMFFVLEFS